MDTPARRDIKIGLIPYNRPALFARCLKSLAPQVDHRNVYMFQDAASCRADESLVEQNIALFRDIMGRDDPRIDRRILVPEQNLGPHRNTIRVYRHLFRDENASFASMAMDDLVFSPLYIEQMNVLAEELGNNPDVGTFGCTGESCVHLSEEEVFGLWTTIVPLRHQIGCAMTRDTYSKMEPYLEFFDFLASKHAENETWRTYIAEFLDAIGIRVGRTGIDSYCCGLIYKMGKYRISTVARHVRNGGVPETASFHKHFNWTFHQRVARNLRWDKRGADFVRVRRDFLRNP